MGKLSRVLLRVLAALAVLAAFVALDWYPTVKDLGLLRRQRGDLERKIREYAIMAARFNFPDEAETSLLTQADGELRRALPLVENDDAWMASARAELLKREKGLANLILVFGKAEGFGPGRPGLTAWLRLQGQEIRQSFEAAEPWRRYLWHGVFPMDPAAGERLASRPLGIALEAPLPVLFDFINRVSWGAARLEIVRLRLEPAGESARAWLVCGGSYLVTEPSPWRVKMEHGEGDEELLIDRDSPLLLRKVDPLLAPRVEKKELPAAPPVRGGTAGSPW